MIMWATIPLTSEIHEDYLRGPARPSGGATAMPLKFQNAPKPATRRERVRIVPGFANLQNHSACQWT